MESGEEGSLILHPRIWLVNEHDDIIKTVYNRRKYIRLAPNNDLSSAGKNEEKSQNKATPAEKTIAFSHNEKGLLEVRQC